MTALRARPAVPADAAPFVAQMREPDRAALATLGDPARILQAGIADASWCRVAEDETGCVALWGIVPYSLLDAHGLVWVATTGRMLVSKQAFLRECRAWAEAMRTELDLGADWSAVDFVDRQKWLVRWCGFHLGAVAKIDGRPQLAIWWGRLDPATAGGMRTALQLAGRVEKLEREARQESTPTIGAVVAAILDGRHPGPRLSDEELGRCKVGRLLLQRRARAELGFPER
jgi:hypothetical protein